MISHPNERRRAMYEILVLDRETRDMITVEAETLADGLGEIAGRLGLDERGSLRRLHVCTMIDRRPQVGLVRFADGSRYDGRLA